MTSLDQRAPAERQSLEEAAAWKLQLRDDPSLELSARFLRWMGNDTNSRAFAAIQAGSSALSELAASPQLLQLRSAALARARRLGVGRWLPLAALRRLAVAALLVGSIGAGASYYYSCASGSYATAVAERREITLSDGSRIALDATTAVQVHYSKAARMAVLDHGRARFDVAQDALRPFSVTVGTETVTALGTSFDVEKLGAKVLVTLIQGQVVVRSTAHSVTQAAPNHAVALAPGQQWTVSDKVPSRVTVVNMQAVTAWKSGQLVFRDETLADAAARMNRYIQRPVIVDPSVASLRITGVFNAGDAEAFVSAVTSYFPVQATLNGDHQVELQRVGPRSSRPIGSVKFF